MKTEQIMRELKTINERITRVENQLKTLDYAQHEESSSKIDYLAMMTDVELEPKEEGGEDDL